MMEGLNIEYNLELMEKIYIYIYIYENNDV